MSLYLRFPIILAPLACFFICQIALAQALISNSTKWDYTVWHGGQIGYGPHHELVVTTPLPLISLLLDEKVAKDLKLSSNQKRELESLQKNLLNSVSKIEDSFEKERDWVEARRQCLAIIGPEVESVLDAMDELLEEVQRDRLRQILVQVQICRRGFLWLIDSPFGDELGLSKAEAQEFKELYLKLSREALSEIEEFKKSTFDEILELAPREVQEKLRSVLFNSDDIYRIPLCVLCMQLKREFFEEVIEAQAESHWPEYAGYSWEFRFEFAELSNLKRVQSPIATGFELERKTVFQTLLFCCVTKELELSKKQKQVLKDMYRSQIELRKCPNSC